MALQHEQLTSEILAACFEVSNELGAGFLESVYRNALVIALRQKGLQVEFNVPLTVNFRGENVGDFFADLVVEGKIIVELKAASALVPGNKAQLMNYLRATGLDTGLLVNFGNPRLDYKRVARQIEKHEHEMQENK
jgi:GxxExxY protein